MEKTGNEGQGLRQIRFKADGMICPQCEDDIRHALICTRGITEAFVSYRRSEVEVTYMQEVIREEDIYRVTAEAGYPKGEGKSGQKSDLLAALGVVLLFLLLPAISDRLQIPDADEGTGYAMLFLIGLLSGVHCICMCGGIMLSTKRAAVYNIGRLLSYIAIGALLGQIGRVISYDGQVRSMILTLSGLLVVLVGLMMWGVPFLKTIGSEVIKPCRFRGTPFVIGLLNGLMPCGALSAMWSVSVSKGSALQGAMTMGAFGLGTCLPMMAFGIFGVLIPKKYNKYLLKVNTVLIVALGAVLIKKGLLALQFH